MYGQIHVIIRSLVTSEFGEETWNAIAAKAGVDEAKDFLVFHYYSDVMCGSLVAAASEILGIKAESVLEAFGDYFIKYVLENGYDMMLRTLGDTFESFIQNLDSLHSMLKLTYSKLSAPSFRCEKISDGEYLLHYYSTRTGLHPIVSGCIRAVGRELYGVTMTGEVLEITESEGDGINKTHVLFKVTVEGETELVNELATTKEVVPLLPTHQIINAHTFCILFPYHLIFDQDLEIHQCGVKLRQLASMATVFDETTKMSDIFQLLHPPIPFTFQSIQDFINANYLMAIKNTNIDGKGELLLMRGQMMPLPDSSHILFVGSPRLGSLTEMMKRRLYFSDIPIYDVTRELILLNQQRSAEIEISKKLDETTAQLKRTSRLLEVEKEKTDNLLYQMLPIKVANMLREGLKVDAEKYAACSILFSDIVTFTNIAAAVQPIDIVQMLNTLYSKFDALTNANDVYKVETIGDAYMVVGGVPEVDETHAQKVANQGLGMIVKAAEVCSPATGIPLQIRVGIHSGPVVAGVVGDKMPRYCLFGDTVNTASRMESHGIPGQIHCSGATYNELLKSPEYKLVSRGENIIKGKGKMITYFLYSNGDITITKPDPPDEKKEKDAKKETETKQENGRPGTGAETNDKESKGNKKNGGVDNGDLIDVAGYHYQGVQVADMQECTSKTCAMM